MSVYSLSFTRNAEKSLRTIYRSDRRLYDRFTVAFQTIQSDPGRGKPLLKNLKDLHSYRLGSYRILYEVHNHRLHVIIIDLGHRKAIYGGR